MTRNKLPDRNPSENVAIEWQSPHGFQTQTVHVTFNFDTTGRVVACFVSANKDGDMFSLVTDACILISRALQHGDDVQSLSKSMGEYRKEEHKEGDVAPASSIIGEIMRTAVQVQLAQRLAISEAARATPAAP